MTQRARKPKTCPRCKLRTKSPNNGYCKECRAEYDRDRRDSGCHRVFTCGHCAVCGDKFVSANKNRVIGKYCSTACEKRAIRRRHNKRYRQRDRWKRRFKGDTREWVPVVLGDPCAYCGAPSTDIEHIVPKSRGGDDTWENIAGACGACNGRKGAKSLLAFLLTEISTS